MKRRGGRKGEENSIKGVREREKEWRDGEID